MQQYVDELVTVSDEDIAAAILIYMERIRVVVEGAGAASLAALVSRKVQARWRVYRGGGERW